MALTVCATVTLIGSEYVDDAVVGWLASVV